DVEDRRDVGGGDPLEEGKKGRRRPSAEELAERVEKDSASRIPGGRPHGRGSSPSRGATPAPVSLAGARLTHPSPPAPPPARPAPAGPGRAPRAPRPLRHASPSALSRAASSRQPGSERTHTRRKTRRARSFSISRRAAVAISFRRAPSLPMRIAFWFSFSTTI